MPYSSTTNVFSGSELGVTSAIRFLNENRISNVLSFPSFSVQSNKEIYFTAVENIPYKVASSAVNGASQSNTETIEYRDIGLKIKLLPKVVRDIVYIDLDLIVENIIDKTSATPSTTKRSLNNSFQLTKGKILVLSGINQVESSKTEYGVPLIKDIPFVGELFKFKTINKIDKSLTIAIEIL